MNSGNCCLFVDIAVAYSSRQTATQVIEIGTTWCLLKTENRARQVCSHQAALPHNLVLAACACYSSRLVYNTKFGVRSAVFIHDAHLAFPSYSCHRVVPHA